MKILQLYFFKDVKNYVELKKKTDSAYKRNSKNIRKASIVKSIKLDEVEASEIFNNLKLPNHFIINNLSLMKIDNGTWQCIKLYTTNRAIIIMSNGYPYAKFVAFLSNSKMLTFSKNVTKNEEGFY